MLFASGGTSENSLLWVFQLRSVLNACSSFSYQTHLNTDISILESRIISQSKNFYSGLYLDFKQFLTYVLEKILTFSSDDVLGPREALSQATTAFNRCRYNFKSKLWLPQTVFFFTREEVCRNETLKKLRKPNLTERLFIHCFVCRVWCLLPCTNANDRN